LRFAESSRYHRNMGKKRGDKPPVPTTETTKRVQYPFRPDDPRILQAAEACGESMRQSINGVLNLALAEYLKARGFWPPPPKS
jgi:hypothetical protein